MSMINFCKKEDAMQFKHQQMSLLAITFILAFMACYSETACAVNGTNLIDPAKNFLTDNVIKNAGVLGVLVAFVIGIVAAIGQQIGKFILNNLGYVGYVAFGGAITMGALTAAGMTL